MASRFEVDDRLRAEIEPLIPVKERRRRYPGRGPWPARSSAGACVDAAAIPCAADDPYLGCHTKERRIVR